MALVDQLRADLRVALRGWGRAPVVTGAAVLSIAAGIGANVAIFSFVNAVVLKHAPVADPQSLVMLSRSSDTAVRGSSFPHPFFAELQAAPPQGMTGLFARTTVNASAVVDESTPDRVMVELVSPGFFRALGVPIAMGRDVTAQDDEPGAEPVVVVSDGYWRGRLANDPQVVGRFVSISGTRTRVVGVASHAFTGVDLGSSPDMWVPLAMHASITGTASRVADPREWWLQITGRLKPGAGRTETAAELSARFHRFVTTYAPATNTQATRVRLLDGRRGQLSLQGRLERPLMILTALGVAVLVLVSVNVTNLVAGRLASRHQEFAIRAALGAGRARAVAQVLVEMAVLVVGGAAAGVALAWQTVRPLAILAAPATGGAPLPVAFDGMVVTFVAGAILLVVMICGAWPAWHAASRTARVTSFGKGNDGPDRVGRRRWLVAVQIALAFALLVGASLFTTTLRHLRHVDLGADPDHVAMLRVDPTPAGLTAPAVGAFHGDVLRRLRALPDTISAARAAIPIMGNNTWGTGVVLDSGARDARPERNAVSEDYFKTLGTRLIEGREFTSADGAGAERVAIVNETFARTYLDGTALGRRIGPAETTGRADARVIGIVRNGKYATLREGDVPMWYVPLAQIEQLGHSDTAERIRAGVSTLYLRTAGDPATVITAAVRAIGAVNPRVMVSHAKTVAGQIDEQLAVERLLARLAEAFALIAILLAVVGLYAVTANDVSMRRREFGIRAAVGASANDVVRLVLTQVALVIVVGVAGGTALALAVTRSVQTLLFGVDAADPAVFSLAAGVVAIVTLAAAWIPARRASRVDPTTALR